MEVLNIGLGILFGYLEKCFCVCQSARDDEKKERKIGSRSSSKTQISKEILETVEPTDGEPKEQEKQWPVSSP